MGDSNALQTMTDVVRDPISAIRRYKETLQKPVFGYFCTYTPEEMIHAAGGIPFRILGAKKKVENADAHLQSYSCSLVRTGLDLALLGELDFLTGTVFPHTCDSIQRLSDIWRVSTDFPFHGDIVLPVKLHTESSLTYMKEELQRFWHSLSEYRGAKISDEELWESIRLYNRMRENLTRLYELKRSTPGIIASKSVNDIVQAAMFMPPEEHVAFTDEILSGLPTGSDDSDVVRVFLSGNLCVFPEIYDFIEGAGGMVIGDDMCTGSRYFSVTVGETIQDPIEAISDRLMKRPICAAKHSQTFDRGAYLKSLVESSHADGVIFLLLKFCDPHSFDYPYLKESLAEIDIPHLLIETEMDNPTLGQVKTRIEAFIEMIGDNRGRK
jgi:bcr-type benzoyl-CoA reductase subunit C